MQYIIIGLVSLILYSPALADTLQGKVVKFADGDTVTIVDDLGDKHRIRLAGIDAPEKDQPYGLESTKNLERLINGKRTTINFSKHDRYGRIVGKVLVDPPGDAFCMAIGCVKQIDLNLEQIKAGMAWHYKYYQMEQSEEDRQAYSDAEETARENLLGLWKEESAVPPWERRRQ